MHQGQLAFAKSVLLLFAIASLAPAAQAARYPYAIYGADDRKEIYQSTDPAQEILAESVVAIMSKNDLKVGAGGKITVTGDTYGSFYNLCPNERFIEQTAPAYCSGFLVGDDIIATAGHCVREQGFCEDARFVFGFMKDTPYRNPNDVKGEDVYSCKNVLADEMNDEGADYAFVQLDRKVIGRETLTFAKKNVAATDSVFVIGHPSGLPAKIADGANVRSVDLTYFTANLDTFSGNSGSAVFNDNYEVAGILVRGEEDFAMKDGCAVSYHCKNELCRGEDVTKSSVLRTRLRQIQGKAPQIH